MKSDSLIAKSNNEADEGAKHAATATCMGPLLVAEDCKPLTTLSSLITAQHTADTQPVWWSPFLASTVDRTLSNCIACEENLFLLLNLIFCHQRAHIGI